MSLNGDVTVIRNGRSTSTVSIYNYPEHLNPFYEDDQHKRLRFWPVNKKGDGEGRRNSFSLGGFKDMWAFKSFRTKKKSSTLGINKTSESPPTLRRAYPIDSADLFNSYDRRARYSSNDNSDNFQRNASYRSSLQNVQSQKQDGFGLNRNDQYRSTIQFGNRAQTTNQTLPVPQARRYVYGGSATPTPSRYSETGRGLTHGSSQTSISTNPFDSDYDEESEHVGNTGGDTTSLGAKRTPRKKRRAPAPPIPSSNGSSPANRLSTDSSQANQAQSELRIEENVDIANLTAEIESFVKTKNQDSSERKNNAVAQSQDVSPNKEAPKTNGTVPKAAAKPILRTSRNMVITKQFKPQPKNLELQINEELKIEEKPALPEKKRKKAAPSVILPDKEPIGNVECIHVHVESPRSTPEPDTSNRLTSFKKEPTSIEKVNAKMPFTLASPPPINRRDNPQQKGQVTERITTTKKQHEAIANGHVQGQTQTTEEHITNGTQNVKPSIAPKPAIESTNKANNLAVIHKPGRRHVVLSSETEDSSTSNPKIVKTEEIIIEEVHKPKRSSETTTTQIVTTDSSKITETKSCQEKDETNENKTNTGCQNPNQKHVLFQTVEANDKVMPPVPESRTSVEKKPEISPRSKKENTKINNFSGQSSKDENLHRNEEPHATSSTNDGSSSQPLPLHTNGTSSLEIVETQESSLRIDEPTTSSSSSVTAATSSSNVTPKPRTELLSESREEFEALYRHRPSSHAQWKQSSLAPLETRIPPEKRRSVKEIIESINRSQRLLHAAAQKDLPELITTRSMPPPPYSEVVVERSSRAAERQMNTIDNDLSQTLRALDETQRELDSMFPSTSAASINDSASPPSHLNSHNSNSNDDSQKPNNEEIFKKDRVNKEVYDYRETSPTASNLDWNPVPKPKRSKNLGEQYE